MPGQALVNLFTKVKSALRRFSLRNACKAQKNAARTALTVWSSCIFLWQAWFLLYKNPPAGGGFRGLCPHDPQNRGGLAPPPPPALRRRSVVSSPSAQSDIRLRRQIGAPAYGRDGPLGHFRGVSSWWTRYQATTAYYYKYNLSKTWFIKIHWQILKCCSRLILKGLS